MQGIIDDSLHKHKSFFTPYTQCIYLLLKFTKPQRLSVDSYMYLQIILYSLLYFFWGGVYPFYREPNNDISDCIVTLFQSSPKD